MNKGFTHAPLIIALFVVTGVATWWYVEKLNSMSSVGEFPISKQVTTGKEEKVQENYLNTATQSNIQKDSRTYSTHPLIKAYLDGPTEIQMNTVWKGSVVIPPNTINIAGAPDVMWGDGTADPEFGGSPWKYNEKGAATITHTYSSPGNYTITIYINGGAGVGFEQGTVVIKKTVTVR